MESLDPEQAKKNFKCVSRSICKRVSDSVSYLIDVFTNFKNQLTTDFGKSFFQREWKA